MNQLGPGLKSADSLRTRNLPEFVHREMNTSRGAQQRWARTSVGRRLKIIREFRHLPAQHALQLAESSALPRSRPVAESCAAEVLPLAEAARFLERNAAKLLAPRRLGRRGLPIWLRGVHSEIHREPLGLVLIIGPGNYPLLLHGVQALQALTAGNAVVLKPGVGGLPAAEALRELLISAGLDSNLFVVLPEDPAAAQAAITGQPDKILFTGSAKTGEHILSDLAHRLIPATMELSGCDAVIVRPGADLDLVVNALRFGLTLNAGATCMAPKRVFVSATLATELEGRLAQLQNGRRARRGTTQQLEPNAAPAARLQLLCLIQEALSSGAHIITGDIESGGVFRFPLILGGVSPSARLLQEDIFAPVLASITVDTDEEAVRRTNECPFALAASIFSKDEAAARRLASGLRAGVVTINDLILPTADARVPFGGRGKSGFGTTRGSEGLLELTTSKVITVTRTRFRPALNQAHPADDRLFGNTSN